MLFFHVPLFCITVSIVRDFHYETIQAAQGANGTSNRHVTFGEVRPTTFGVGKLLQFFLVVGFFFPSKHRIFGFSAAPGELLNLCRTVVGATTTLQAGGDGFLSTFLFKQDG